MTADVYCVTGHALLGSIVVGVLVVGCLCWSVYKLILAIAGDEGLS